MVLYCFRCFLLTKHTQKGHEDHTEGEGAKILGPAGQKKTLLLYIIREMYENQPH